MTDIECQCNGSSQAVCSTCCIDLLQQLETLTQERDALKRIIDDTLREVPVGNVNAHIPENLSMDMEYYVQETVKQDFEIERLEKERDALRDVVQEIDDTVESIFDDGGLVVTHYKIPAYVISKALSLLTPSGEAGKGGGV